SLLSVGNTVSYATQRPDRPPHEAARPPCVDGGGTGRQHEQGGGAAQHHSARDLQIDRGAGAHNGGPAPRPPRARPGADLLRALPAGGAAVFDDLRQAVKNVEFLADPTAGEVRIGSSTFLAATFVSTIIKRLSQRYPRIVFHLATETDSLQRELSERNVDLLIA